MVVLLEQCDNYSLWYTQALYNLTLINWNHPYTSRVGDIVFHMSQTNMCLYLMNIIMRFMLVNDLNAIIIETIPMAILNSNTLLLL